MNNGYLNTVDISIHSFDNRRIGNGGAISITHSRATQPSYFNISNNIFIGNKASIGYGGAVYISVEHYSMIFLSNTVFESNSASNGGALFIHYYGTIDTNNITLINNRATDSGGAMNLSYSFINTGNIFQVINNTTTNYGGGIVLHKSALEVCDIYKEQEASLTVFLNNRVTSSNGKGGAIFLLPESDCVPKLLMCSIRVIDCNISRKYLQFGNNHGSNGSILYDGHLDKCVMGYRYDGLPYYGYEVIPNMLKFQNGSNYDNQS